MWFLLLLFSQIAHAGCNNLKIENLSNVDFQLNLTPTETFTVQRSGSPGCSFFLTLNNGAASAYSARSLFDNGNTIPLQVYSNISGTTIPKHFSEIGSNADVIIGTFPDGDINPKTISFDVFPRLGNIDYQTFGSYQDQLTMRLYQGTWNGTYSLEDTDSFELKYNVDKKIDLSIVNAGAAFDQSATNKTLNFGSLSTNQQMSFDLVVKYNAGYRVRVSSQNNGALKRISFSDTIPYTLNMNSNPVSLSGSSSNPVLVSQGGGVSPTGGLRFASTITIGNMGTPPTGTYQDAITITVSTTE